MCFNFQTSIEEMISTKSGDQGTRTSQSNHTRKHFIALALSPASTSKPLPKHQTKPTANIKTKSNKQIINYQQTNQHQIKRERINKMKLNNQYKD